jgi:hypothetical protein
MKIKKFSDKILSRIIKENERIFWEAQAYRTLIEIENKNLA